MSASEEILEFIVSWIAGNYFDLSDTDTNSDSFLDSEFEHFGMDSIDVVEMCWAIDEDFEITVSLDENVKTIRQFVECVTKELEE